MTAQTAPACVTEALETRYLLAAVLDVNQGILTITGSENADIIQFLVADTADASTAPASFTVLESTSTSSSPPLSFPTRQQVLDLIDSGGTPVATTFDLAGVREIRIASAGGNDLAILGRDLPRPVFVDAGEGQDSVSGGDGDDTLLGGAGDDYLFGRDRNDILDGGTGADELLGGEGNDTVDYQQRTAGVSVNPIDDVGDDGEAGESDNVRSDVDGIVGGSGNDLLGGDFIVDDSAIPPDFAGFTLHGHDGDDTLIGGDFADRLFGGAGQDSIVGNGRNDRIFAEDGEEDELDGGDGDDVAVLDAELDSFDPLEEDILLLADSAQDLDTVPGGSAAIESGGLLRITGTESSDVVMLVRSANGASLFVVESSGAAEEPFVSQFGLNQFNGVRVELGGGDDILHAGTIDSGEVTDARSLAFFGGAGHDVLIGSAGDDELYGDDGDDLIFGRGGDDDLIGRAGADHLSGGVGDDIAIFSDRDDLASVGRLPDDGERGEGDNLQPDVELLHASDGNDRLTTHLSAPVTLFGGFGRDTLVGGQGADMLDGGRDPDLLEGLGGADTFFSNSFEEPFGGGFPSFSGGNAGGPGTPADPDTIRGGSGNDVIADSDNADTIDLGEDE